MVAWVFSRPEFIASYPIAYFHSKIWQVLARSEQAALGYYFVIFTVSTSPVLVSVTVIPL
jgi:hypothetical protein